MKLAATFLLLLAAFCTIAGTVTVLPENAVIVVPRNSCNMVRFAGSELQRHLKMMTSKTIPIVSRTVKGKYAFILGKPAKYAPLKPEEARWQVGENQTLLYGDTSPLLRRSRPEAFVRTSYPAGDLTAVYAFLGEQLGFLYLEPGPKGTAYKESPVLTLKEGNFFWEPGRMKKRGLRSGYLSYKRLGKDAFDAMPAFYREKARKEYDKKAFETQLWLRQHHMGASVGFSYGHAFTRWWGMFGKTNPEFFALVDGKRELKTGPAGCKMCVSNPALIKKIVELWAKKKPRPAYINVCENDGGFFCECANCRALDMPAAPGKVWYADLSDRYLHFANSVLREARKIDPKVKVTFYAYSYYRYPPRRVKAEPGIIFGFVPRMTDLDIVDQQYKEWRKMGAELIFQRPNDQHYNTGLPMGFEKMMFDHFQIGYKNGIIGTDYDSIHNYWTVTGVADYILARAHVNPSKSFDYWMDQYASAFGESAPEVKAFFAYFRTEVWEKRLMPNREEIGRKGRYGNFRRGLMWNMGTYFKEKDFDLTDAILKKGLAKKLTPQQRERLETLLLGNLHSRMTLRALSAVGTDKIMAGKKLLDFRIRNWDKLNIDMFSLFNIEADFGDVSGIKRAAMMENYTYVHPVGIVWYFTPDPKNEGDGKGYSAFKQKQYARWSLIRTDAAWERQGSNKFMKPEMKKFLANYDGIGWYAAALKVPQSWKGKEVALILGAVDESCKVYVNGKLCGSLTFDASKDPDSWKNPFRVRIDQFIDWNKRGQDVVVRVEDKGGQGGIWRTCMLVAR